MLILPQRFLPVDELPYQPLLRNVLLSTQQSDNLCHIGLLYIGETKTLRRRFQRIWRGINLEIKTKSDKINTLRKNILFCNLHQSINLDEYEIIWEELDTKLEAQIQEAAALKLYTEKFKEPPPLNFKVCREKYAIWGLGIWNQSKWSGEPNEFVRSIIS